MFSKMLKTEKYLFWIAVFLFPLVYFLPLWEIVIYAPQYPEGLTMTIWLDKITGDIQNFNILNHYVGMKKIDADSIPELKYFTKVVLSLWGFGLLCVLMGRRIFRSLWLATILSAAVLGLYDFYLWEYDFGHNLSPDAPIITEGMSYSPPLIGFEQLLNISIYSYPASGGIFVTSAILLVLLSLFFPLLSKKAWMQTLFAKMKIQHWLTVILIVFTVSCTPKGPEPIVLGVHLCDHCHMTITDGKFASEWLSKKGKYFHFDSLDCLQKHIVSVPEEAKDAKIFLSDFSSPGSLVDVNQLTFLKAKKLRGPMGTHWLATKDQEAIKRYQAQFDGEILNWAAVSTHWND